MQYKTVPTEEHELIEALARIPATLAQEQAKLEGLKDEYRRLEAKYKLALNSAYLHAEGSVREREATSENDHAVQAYLVNLLEFKREIGMCEVNITYVENAFASARKIANLIETQMKIMPGTQELPVRPNARR